MASIDSLLKPVSSADFTVFAGDGVSLRKLHANRLNAQHSTGPRTSQGKARVARNALTHGIFAQSLLLDDEDHEMFHQHRKLLLADIKPQNYSERLLAERIISASWRLERLQRAEFFEHDALAHDARTDLLEGKMPGEREMRQQKVPDRESFQHNQEIERRRREWAFGYDVPPGLTLAVALQSPNGVLERYNRYEQRLDGIIQRAWRELRLLRAERETIRALPDTPYCSDPAPPAPATSSQTPVSERSEEPDPSRDSSASSPERAPECAPAQPSATSIAIMQNKPTEPEVEPKTNPDLISTA